MRDAVVALAKKAGVPYDKIYIYNGSKQSNRYTANVSGLGSSARVAMSDVMFAEGGRHRRGASAWSATRWAITSINHALWGSVCRSAC